MNQNDLHLRLNHHQLELIQKIRKEHELVDKSNNEVLRFIIEDYDKQTQELKEEKEFIKKKLNFISREMSMTLNSLLNLIDQQRIDITKANDQMIQYHQANKLLNQTIVGQPSTTTQYTPEEIEEIKRQERAEKRKEIAKKIHDPASSIISNKTNPSLDFLDENPF